MRTISQFQRVEVPTAAPRLIENGIEVCDHAVWVWVHIPPGATHLLEDDELSRATLDASAALRQLIPPGAEYHIKVLWARASSQRYRDSWTHAPGVWAPGTPGYVELGAHRIDLNADHGFFRQRVVMLGMHWPSAAPTSPVTGTRSTLRKLRSERFHHRQARHHVEEIRPEINRWLRRMQDSPLRAEPAPAGMIAWAYAREMRRGALQEIPDAQELSGARLVNLAHGVVDPTESEHYVTVTDTRTGHRRYVTVLAASLNGFPIEELSIPGGEWLEMLTELPGVEASVRGRHFGQQGSLKRIDQARKITRSQLREAEENGAEAPTELPIANDVLADRRQEIARRMEVETENHPRWVVDAASPEELAEAISRLQQHYAGTVHLEVIPHVQKLLWQEILPGDRIRVPEFGQDQPMRTLAGSWFHGGSALGDTVGPYFGANLGTTPGPVQLALFGHDEATRGQPTTVTFTGKSGSGKSTGVMLTALGALALGAWLALVDPKGDLAGIITAAEQVLGVPVQRIDVLDEASAGMMDPMRFAGSADDARSLTLDALLGALSTEDRRRGELLLERAVDTVLARPRSTWQTPAVIAKLCATPETDPSAQIARELGETLQLRAKLAQLRPVLGPLSEHARPLMTGRGLVYLGLSGLALPRHTPDPDRWTVVERASMTTLRAALAYALQQSRHAAHLHKVVALTELHLLTRYSEGRAFTEWIARTGRALKLFQLLDSQSAMDMAEIPALVEQIVLCFAFLADGEAEQDAQAVLLHRPEPGPRLREAQAGLRVGECVVRDRQGQLGLMQFDRLTTGLAQALDTTAPADTGDDGHRGASDRDSVQDEAGEVVAHNNPLEGVEKRDQRLAFPRPGTERRP